MKWRTSKHAILLWLVVSCCVHLFRQLLNLWFRYGKGPSWYSSGWSANLEAGIWDEWFGRMPFVHGKPGRKTFLWQIISAVRVSTDLRLKHSMRLRRNVYKATSLQILRVTASWCTFLVCKSEGHTCPGDEDQPQTKAASSWLHQFCSASKLLPGMWYQEEDLRNLMANSTAWDPRDPSSHQISAPVTQ